MGNIFWSKEKADAAKDKSKKPAEKAEPKKVTAATNVSPVNFPVGQVADYSQHFIDLMENSNLPGPDYYEFMKAIHTLDGQPLMENQKYIASFASLNAMGITVDKLVETAMSYVKDMEADEANFNQSLATATANKVTSKQKTVEQLTLENQNLARKMQENTAKMGLLNTEIMSEQQRLASEETGYKSAYTQAKQTIMSNIEKIKTYLNGPTTTR